MENEWVKRIEELEAERDADRKREYGYSQQTVDALTVERDNLKADNKRLRNALSLITSFIPDGWQMPLGWNQVVAQAQGAFGGKP